MMYKYSTILIDGSVSNDIWERVDRFKYRAGVLSDFIKDRSWGVIQLHGDRESPNQPKIKGSIPDELELEGLYRRFRFFILNNEKSNYRRLLNLLGQAVTDDYARYYLKQERKTFLDNDFIRWVFNGTDDKYSEEEIIDMWFNACYFHDEQNKLVKLNVFKDMVQSNGAESALFFIVYEAWHKVRKLNYLLSETGPERPEIVIPISCTIKGDKGIILEK